MLRIDAIKGYIVQEGRRPKFNQGSKPGEILGERTSGPKVIFPAAKKPKGTENKNWARFEGGKASKEGGVKFALNGKRNKRKLGGALSQANQWIT